jgi:cell division protein FtsQ
MDGRGRELQQIGMTGRFWWRALDAPSPGAYLPHAAGAVGPTPWSYPSRRPAKAQARRDANKLAVPRDQRRAHLRRNGTQQGARLLALSMCAMLASAAGAGLYLSGAFADLKSKLALAQQASALLIAAGFGIDQVGISGHRFTPDADIYDALDLPNTKTFAGFDAAAALKRIERLPWVDTAQITRVFPGALSVQIRERLPAAIWSRADKSYLIDATGRVLGLIAPSTTWALPRISGEGANGEAAMLFVALARYPELQQTFAQGERVAERRWAVVFKNGSRLELGADREAEGLETVHANRELQRALLDSPTVVDVRTPGRPAIRPAAIVQPAKDALPDTGVQP